MAPKKKKVATTKVKKKRWFPIHAPKLFNEKLLGETYVVDESQVEGKHLTANLSTVAGSMKKQNMNVQFRVNKIEEGKAYTEVIGYSLINAAMKRLVRRGRNKIADSFLAKTKDKKVIRIKPIIITHNRGTKSVQSAVRLQIRKFVREYVFTKNADEVFADIVDIKLQKLAKDAVAKIFPIKTVDIRMAKLDESGKTVVTDKAVESEAVTIRSKDKGVKHTAGADEEEAKPVVSQDEEVKEVADDSSEDDNDEPLSEDDEELDTSDEDASDEELEANLEDEDKAKLEDAN